MKRNKQDPPGAEESALLAVARDAYSIAQALREQLSEANARLNAANEKLVEFYYGAKIGGRVRDSRGWVFQVESIWWMGGGPFVFDREELRPWLIARRVLTNGALSEHTSRVYRDWKPI